MAKRITKEGVNGNLNLRSANEQIEYTEDQLIEIAKCKASVEYFLVKYAKIISLDKGVIPFKPHKFQRDAIKTIHANRNTLIRLSRQSGKSTIVAGYIAWYVLFNDDPKRACILANKKSTAIEIFSRVQLIIELCPKWLQRGIKTWNVTSIEFQNGTRCFCAASSPSAVRGLSINCLVLDEFAFLSSKLADEFIASVFPTLSSSTESKMIIVSTPKGLNHFHKMWVQAERGENGFKPFYVPWYDVPGRDEKWAEHQRGLLGDLRFRQEVLCLTGDAVVAIRNKTTGVVERIRLDSLYNRLHMEQ